jgi:methylase of polypeptide subunit release factors
MNVQWEALVALGRKLRSLGYRFTAVTPTTHRIIYERPNTAPSLQSVFGWNQRFTPADIDAEFVHLLRQANALDQRDGGYRSAVRFASLEDLVFVHSGFPTHDPESVFFGPDTYRFARLLRASLADLGKVSGLRVVDVGCGSGAGGIYLSKLFDIGTHLVLADINLKALTLSAINAAINDVAATTVLSDVLVGVEGQADIIVANPPYLVDPEQRLYRHGGGTLGVEIAGRIVEQALSRLTIGGRLVLYTGTPIIAGLDVFFQLVHPLLQLHAQHFVYEEIDPDVFGEELTQPAYAKADRIAAVGLTVIR